MQTRMSTVAAVRWSPVLIGLAALFGVELLWWLYQVVVSATFQPDSNKVLLVVPAALAVTTCVAAYQILVKQRGVGYWVALGLQIGVIVQGIAIGYRIFGSFLGVLEVLVGVVAIVLLYLARVEKARV